MQSFKFSNERFEFEITQEPADTESSCNLTLTITEKTPDYGQADAPTLDGTQLVKSFSPRMSASFVSHTVQDNTHQFHFRNLDKRENCLLDNLLTLNYINIFEWSRAHIILDLNLNIEINASNLISSIQNITNNEDLLELHNSLLSSAWNYLRENPVGKRKEKVALAPISPFCTPSWSMGGPTKNTFAYRLYSIISHTAYQGANDVNEIQPTNKAWAEIERAISLQLILNERAKHAAFTPAIGQQIAQQFKQHAFFAIPRTKSGKEKSNLLVALEEGKADRLDCIRKKTFGR